MARVSSDTVKRSFLAFRILLVVGLAFGFPYYGPPLGKFFSGKIVGVMNDARADSKDKRQSETQKVESGEQPAKAWDPATQDTPSGMSRTK